MRQILAFICLVLCCSCGGGYETKPLGSTATKTVFIGDSIVEFWDLNTSFPAHGYMNKGISGQTSTDIVSRFEADVLQPDTYQVVILAGTNDLLRYRTETELSSNIREMVRRARSAKVRVFLATVPPVERDISVQGPQYANHDFNPEIREHNNWLRSYAAGEGINVVDYWNALTDSQGNLIFGVLKDGVHPTDAGYVRMTDMTKIIVR